MGHPRKARKQYDTPSHPWNAARIKAENKLVVKYGLRTKKEVWKAETTIKRYRRDARFLLGMETEHAEVEKTTATQPYKKTRYAQRQMQNSKTYSI